MAPRIRVDDIDKNDLEYLVHERKMSKIAISKMMECSIDLISKSFLVYEIENISISESIKEQYNNGRAVNCKIYDIPSKEDIEYMYNERGWSLNKLSGLFDTSIPTLKKWLSEYDISIRGIQESLIRVYKEGHTTGNIQVNNDAYCCLDNESWIRDAYEEFSSIQIGAILNVTDCTVQRYLEKYNIKRNNWINKSGQENDLLEYVKSIYPGEISTNYRGLGFELDMYLPERGIAIEYNGLYWHSERVVDKNYHKNKTDKCRDNGIRLIHIWEDDWILNTERIKMWLNTIINPSKPISLYGRKCTVEFIEPSLARNLIDTYHIQGYVNASSCVGLYHDGELISACLFMKKTGNEYYLTRYVVSPEYNVIGGFSKMVKHFIKNSAATELYTFADLSWVDQNNNVYLSNSFEPDKTLTPDYSYIYNKQRVHKFNFRHSSMGSKFGDDYDPSISEHQNCLNNKVYRIYDCGKIRYKYKK